MAGGEVVGASRTSLFCLTWMFTGGGWWGDVGDYERATAFQTLVPPGKLLERVSAFRSTPLITHLSHI